MVNRGPAASISGPLWAIETQYDASAPGGAARTRVKVFASEEGFKAGLRAVRRDVIRRYGPSGFRTFYCPAPSWREIPPP